MTQFRKKPVVIDAVQFHGPNLHEVVSFVEGKAPTIHTSYAGEAWHTYEGMVKENGFKIETLEGVMTAQPGDWIIKGVKGEFYPCKPDIFAATYEAV